MHRVKHSINGSCVIILTTTITVIFVVPVIPPPSSHGLWGGRGSSECPGLLPGLLLGLLACCEQSCSPSTQTLPVSEGPAPSPCKFPSPTACGGSSSKQSYWSAVYENQLCFFLSCAFALFSNIEIGFSPDYKNKLWPVYKFQTVQKGLRRK